MKSFWIKRGNGQLSKKEDSTISVRDLPKVLQRGQCMGCGFCSVALTKGDEDWTPAQVDFRWNAELEHWGPDVSKEGTQGGGEKRICPGARMDMPALAGDVFGRQPADEMVGEARRIASGHASDSEIRRRAASGGLTTAILKHLLESDQIDVAYCSAGRDPDEGHGVIVRDPKDLTDTQGSHYHPLAFGSALPELIKSGDRFAFVGLPCEVAALRQLIAVKPELAERCVVIIGLFCGGINRYSGVSRYLERFGVTPENVDEIDYRDGVWPGQIRVTFKDGTPGRTIPRIRDNSRWNILRYVISFQGYWMLPRCRICPDQIADFADIAVGDPHLPRFKNQDMEGISAVVARTERGERLLREAEETNAISLGELSRDELVVSQGYTLENRRHAAIYARMARRLGMIPPRISVYGGLANTERTHQSVYAFVDLAKIRLRHLKFLRPFYLPFQVFEYLFLTMSPRFVLTRIRKLIQNK